MSNMEKTLKNEVIRLFQFCPACKKNSLFLIETCIPSMNEKEERFNKLRIICVFCSGNFYLNMPSDFPLQQMASDRQRVKPTKADFKRTRSLHSYAVKTQMEAEWAQKNIKQICDYCQKPIQDKFIMRFSNNRTILVCPDCDPYYEKPAESTINKLPKTQPDPTPE